MLANVEQLSLSTNQIEKISNLQGMPKLRILSLGRNNIKKIEGLEAVSETLEELWISYNQIERLNGIECCKKLRVLYAANNKVKAWDGVLPLVSVDFFFLQLNPRLNETHGSEDLPAKKSIADHRSKITIVHVSQLYNSKHFLLWKS